MIKPICFGDIKLSNRNRTMANLAAGAAALMLVNVANAQSTTRSSVAASGELEEVFVTARRQVESAMKVPVAVSALSAADIARYSANDVKKIGELVPQVNMAEAAAGNGASFTIRGIGSASANTGVEQAVAVNIDGVQVGRAGRIVKLGLLDLEQVEVLKGPQALFFGKNSPAGVVSLTSASPGDDTEGYARVGYEIEADERYVEGAVSYPITPTFRARVALRASDMEGFVDNKARPVVSPYDPAITLPGSSEPSPNTEEVMGRLTLVYEPSEAFDATLKIAINSTDKNTDTNGAQVVCARGITAPTSFGVPDPTGDCKLDDRRSVTNMPEVFASTWSESNGGDMFLNLDATVTSLAMNLRAGTWTLTSVTGWAEVDFDAFDDYTYTSISSVWGSNTENYEQLSQEFRAVTDLDSPVNFSLGGYFEDSDFDVLTSAMLGYAGPDPVTGRYYAYTRYGTTTSKTYSLFGQIRWAISDSLELATGARWTKEEKRLERMGHSFNHAVFEAAFVPTSTIFRGNFDEDNVSPEATLSWQFDDQSMLYAAYKTGYKSGGFALPGNLSAAETLDSLKFDSETAKGFEVGYKAELLGRTLRLDMNAFRYEFEDLQVSSFDADTTRFIVRNAAKAVAEGVEASVDWRVTSALSARGAVGYSHTRYDSFPGASCYAGQTEDEGCVDQVQDLSGKAPPRAPEWVFNAGGTYEATLTDALSLALSVDTNFTDGNNVQENNNPVAYQDSFWRLNAAVQLYSTAGWELSLIGRNLTNEYYMESSTDKPVGGPGEIGVGLPRPREIVVQGTWRF